MSTAVSGRYIPKPNEVTTRNKVCQGAAILVGLAGIALFAYACKSSSRSLISRVAIGIAGWFLGGNAFYGWYKIIRPICTDIEYKSALPRQVQRSDKTAVGWILFIGANPNNPDSEGLTPLHVAKDPSIVQQLVSYGADVHADSKSQNTPLHCAFRLSEEKDKIEIIKILVKNGANLNAIGDNGKTLLEKAMELQSFAVAHKQPYHDWEEIIALAGPQKG